ncbi:MAG: hypothetical protein A2X86_11355 [Bdellovibrionales bacterium GWA2_49_15]|nr:MAG: hypothetical protein A2X86_11355 [Bdellovibrionales bacterium GWA2_49_15]HAZ12653.1 hypothetical protein [Bdellovibrionales bacterium]
MKKFHFFLTHLLCHCMLLCSLGSSWNAYAQDGTGSGSGSGLGPEAGDTSGFEDCTTYDENSPEYDDCLLRMGGSGVQAGSGPSAGDINKGATEHDILMSIFAILIALMAIFYICPNNISGILFALGGLFLIITEIVSLATRKDASERALTAISNVDAAQVSAQKDAIKIAKQATQDAADWASRRATMMMIVAIIWTVATVMAIIEAIWRIVSWGSYMDNCLNGNVLPPTPVGSNGKSKSIYAQFYKKNESDLRFFTKDDIEIEDTDQYFIKKELDTSLSLAVTQSPPLVDYKNHHQMQNAIAGGLVFEEVGGFEIDQMTARSQSIIEKISNQFFPTAEAQEGIGMLVPILIAIGAAIAIAVFFRAWAHTSAASGWIRAVFIAIMMAVMWWGYSIAQDKAKVLQERVAAYEELEAKIIAAMPAGPTAPVTTTTSSAASGGNGAPVTTSTAFDPGSGLGGCVSGSPTGSGLAANDCSCEATNSCTKTTVPNTPIPSNFDLSELGGITSTPQTVSDATNNLARNKGVGQNFANTFTQAYAAKLKKAGSKLKAKYIDLLKKKGEKNPKTFDALQKEFFAKVKKDMKTMESKMSPSVMAQIASLGGGPDTSKMAEKLKEMGVEGLAKKSSKFGNLQSDSSVGKLFDDEPAAALDTGKAEAVNSADALSGYENSEQDILKDSGVSIFEQLSTRYRKSAFPIFFMKKKDAQGGETTAPANP